MIAFRPEKKYRLSQIARREGVCYMTVFRWVKKGINGRKLQAELCGGLWKTTLTALAEFNAKPIATDAADDRRRLREEHGIDC
jgi:transposase-like protein